MTAADRLADLLAEQLDTPLPDDDDRHVRARLAFAALEDGERHEITRVIVEGAIDAAADELWRSRHGGSPGAVGPRDLSRLLNLLADEPETVQSTTGAGVLRQAARALVELGSENDRLRATVAELTTGTADGPPCENCGKSFARKKAGRPAKYCCAKCLDMDRPRNS